MRLGSLEPEQMELPVLERLARQEKLCPQFHLSLQSGCDATLKRMNRHYTAAEYESIVNNIRGAVSYTHLKISTAKTTTRPVTRTTRAVSMFSITFTLYYKIVTFPALRLKIAKFPDFNYCAIIARFCLFFNRIWTKKSPSCENFNKLSLFHKENVKKK